MYGTLHHFVTRPLKVSNNLQSVLDGYNHGNSALISTLFLFNISKGTIPNSLAIESLMDLSMRRDMNNELFAYRTQKSLH